MSVTFTMRSRGNRIDIECDQCQDGVDAPANDFGEAILRAFREQHKCDPKGAA